MKATRSGGAAVFGAVLAALCCAGTPLILTSLSAVGLGFLRRDAILLPLMAVTLFIAVTGFWRTRHCSRVRGPLVLGVVGAMALAGGVLVVHGPAAMWVISGGAVALLLATVWDVVARRGPSRADLHRLAGGDAAPLREG